MANERNTEEIYVNHIKKDNLFLRKEATLSSQQTDSKKIKKLLQNASKSGSGNGYPDFFIQYTNNGDVLIVIECKADTRYHVSDDDHDRPKDYAVDGVLLYSDFLAKEYDVISIAISGENEDELRISNFLQLKGTNKAKEILEDDKFYSLNEYLKVYKTDEEKFNQDFKGLLAYSKRLNTKLHSLRIPESERSLLISGILIALSNESFRSTFVETKRSRDLSDNLVRTIIQELDNNVNNNANVNIENSYGFIGGHETLVNTQDTLKEIIREIDEEIFNFQKTYTYFDTLGQFYIEFLRYANNDTKLGIVLTPPHITELFVEIANINKDSIVLDICAGTGGFLISSMQKMIKDAAYDEDQEEKIKTKQIIGVEFQEKIFSLLRSNMYIHGDGRSNLIRGDCFDKEITEQINKLGANVALLNPPYNTEPKEINFILNALSLIQKGSLCVAIVPMSCAISSSQIELRRMLMEKHTLEAVFSMPDELFHGSAVSSTCIMVFKAKEKHPQKYKTYFGFWKDDGFVKVKNIGRFDKNNKWKSIKTTWLEHYKNKEKTAGESVKECVQPTNEWCAEVYMETDYSTLKKNDWSDTIRGYLAYQFSNGIIDEINKDPVSEDEIEIDNWTEFSTEELFDLKRGFQTNDFIDEPQQEYIQYLRPSKDYKIQKGYVLQNSVNDNHIHSPMSLVMGNTGQGSHTYTYLISEEFVPSNNLTVLLPKHQLNIYHKIFLINIIEHNRYRYNYGRVPSDRRFLSSKLGLPADANGKPDWGLIENYIKSLPFSSSLMEI